MKLINIKTKKFEFKLNFEKGILDDEWEFISVTKTDQYKSGSWGCTSTVHYTPSDFFFGWIKRPIYKLKWKIELKHSKLKYSNATQCQGCGEGVAKHIINDPNIDNGQDPKDLPKKVKKVRCCDKCVNFYNWGSYYKEIKLKVKK